MASFSLLLVVRRVEGKGARDFCILTVPTVETTKAKWATASQQRKRTRIGFKSQKK